ncbi:MAG: tRNA pseudouridine(38-40) synthase TruA [Candidatus Omnitrophica bacterium]|nr:tRNA pseudouridine(38-40) synthase TruA [Candidatus Omnitrophota bacterium]MCM8792889.1 tRNA pseudouridine(38-40) synthase TruA [Candidatus Omnitrophota bacterium]
MRNFKLLIEYEGTNYWGWQIQNLKSKIKNQKLKIRTVQGEIEKALKKIFGKSIRLIGSGRTDAGVHALGQVANFKVNTKIKPTNIKDALNRYLPPDIRIVNIEEVEENFHARFSARAKIYRYFILNRRVPSAFYRNYSWWVKEKLDFQVMGKAARIFLGTHDFKSFASTDPKRKSDNFVRTIKKVLLKKHKHFIIFEIEADGFLHNMVRNMVGTLVEVGKGKLTPFDVENILKSHDRRFAPPPAPSQGLFLVKVKY